MKIKLVLGWLLATLAAGAQQIVLPDSQNWNIVDEGKSLQFKIGIRDSVAAKRFLLSGSNGYNMHLDSLGNFSWTPGFDVVDRLEREKEISVIVEAEMVNGNRARQPATFKVVHVNRPPVAEALPVFYVKQSSGNTYQIFIRLCLRLRWRPHCFQTVPKPIARRCTDVFIRINYLVTIQKSVQQFEVYAALH